MGNGKPNPVFYVTGGLGFLGQYIVQEVHKAYPESLVRVQARSKRKYFLPIDHVQQVQVFHADLSDPEEYAKQLEGVDVIVHNAAMVSFKKVDREEVIRSNIEGTRHLVEAAIAKGVKQFIYISSISAVAKDPPNLSDESKVPDLEELKEDAYGYSKRMGELLLAEYQDKIRVVMINPSVIIGPGSKRIAGIQRILRWVPMLPMLKTKNSFVDVRDVASSVIDAYTRGVSGERYIITAWNVSMDAFMRSVVEVMGRSIPVIGMGNFWIKLGDIVIDCLDFLHLNPGMKRLSALNVDKVYDNRKAKLELSWSPRFSLKETLKDMLTWENDP